MYKLICCTDRKWYFPKSHEERWKREEAKLEDTEKTQTNSNNKNKTPPPPQTNKSNKKKHHTEKAPNHHRKKTPTEQQPKPTPKPTKT